VGQFLSGNNEDFYRNNNASSADVIISQDARHHNNSGDKPQTRLLVVDDEPDIVHVLKLGLQQNGFLVDAFSNPEEALQSLKSNAESYCLVLSDVRMPGLSGIQLAKRVKEINPNVKVVLMTA
jgi:DNA-binding NtrC family response regulator